MRRLMLALAVTAASLGVALSANRAEATVLKAPQGLRAAIEATDVTATVHCRPGRWHHRYRPHDGCYRRYYFGGPEYYYGGPFYFGGRRAYSSGPLVYGPGVYLGFGGPYRRYWR